MSTDELGRRIAAVSSRYLGAAYQRDPLGEGPNGSVDRDPLFCRTGVDCQTFVEQVVAEALARRREEILPLLTRIRYRDGVIDFGTRNHYMVSDWLPHNNWCVRDQTASVGGGRARAMEKMIDRAAFFRSHGVPALGDGIAPEASRTSYLPRALVPEIVGRVPNGAVLIWVQDRPGIIAAHCGFAIRGTRGTVLFRHASERFGRVMDEPLIAYARRAPDRIVGVKICQAFPQLDTIPHAR
jgi:N-acetylmuramoyl-L-alanine amidase-like